MKTQQGKQFLSSFIPFEDCFRLDLRSTCFSGLEACIGLKWDAKDKSDKKLICLDKNTSYGNSARVFKSPFGQSITMLPPQIDKDLKICNNGEVKWADGSDLHGFAIADVTSPEVMVPILPMRRRQDKKVLSTLCKSCGNKESKKHCTCPKEDRPFVTVVPINLLNYACRVKKYRINYLHEVQAFPNADYLLKPFFDVLLSMKMAFDASEDMNLDEKDTFCLEINEFFELKDSVKLKISDLKTSKRKAKLVKICLKCKKKQSQMSNWADTASQLSSACVHRGSINACVHKRKEHAYMEAMFRIAGTKPSI